MRRSQVNWEVFFLSLTLLLLSFMASGIDEETQSFGIDYSATAMVGLIRTGGSMQSSGQANTPGGMFWVRTSLTPPSGHIGSTGEQLPFLRGKTLSVKPLHSSGYFLSAMVILLFFIFYQMSRTGSDEAFPGSVSVAY